MAVGIGQRALWLVIVVASLGYVSLKPALANEEEAARLTLPIAAAVLAADSASDAEAKLVALRTARFELSRLAQRAKVAGIVPAETSATLALERLSDQGIQRDILSYRIVLTELSQLASATDPAQRNAIENEIRGTAEGLDNASYRAGAFFSIGERLAATGSGVRARAYTNSLLKMAEESSDSDLRASLGMMAAKLAARTDGVFSSDLADALTYMPDLRTRAAMFQLIARDIPRGARNDNERIPRIAALLQDGDFRAATALSMALELDSEARGANLILCIQRAIEAEDFQVANVSLMALSTRKDQRQAFDRIGRHLSEQGLLLQSLRLLEIIEDDELRLSGYASLASDLDELGYEDLATATFDRGLTVARRLGPDQVAYIARSMANSGREEESVRIAIALPVSAPRSHALAAAAKHLAATGRVDRAEALLPDITVAVDRSLAVSGIASAHARAGDLESAQAFLSALVEQEHIDRVRGAIAERLAADGDLVRARQITLEISAGELQLEGILAIIEQAHLAGDFESIKSDLGRAVRIARAEGGSKRDRMLLQIVETEIRIADLGAASSIAEGIQAAELRDRAQTAIAEAMARSGQYPEAIQRLDLIQGGALRNEATARTTLAALEGGADAVDAIRTISALDDPLLRRTTLRSAAEILARQNDSLGLLGGKPRREPASKSVGMTRSDRTPAKLGNGITLLPVDGAPARFSNTTLPDLSVSAEDLRATLPAPVAPLHVTVALMTNADHFTKFFEDLIGGRTGADKTIEAQRLAAPKFVLVRSGVVTLGSLVGRLSGAVTADKGTISVHIPILVAPDATLVLSGLEASEFRLSSSEGAFIVNAGRLVILDANVTGWDAIGNRPDYRIGKAGGEQFRPFIVSWSGSLTEVGGSHLKTLGYHAPKAFGLAITSGPSALTKKFEKDERPTGVIVDNTIENFEYGFYSYEADSIKTIGNDYNNNIVYAVDPHDRSRDLIFAFNTTRGTQLKHGIIGSREVNESYIVGNVAFDNKGSGFMLDRSSVGNILYANFSFENKQDGISLFESSCNLIVGNRLEGNQRAGVKIRNSWDVGVYHNEIMRNRATGIEGYIVDLTRSPGSEGRDYQQDPYSPITTFSAGWNVIEHNGAGISMTGASGASLIENTFRFPNRKLMGGDVLGATVPILQNSGRGVLIESTCKPRLEFDHCPLRQQGLLGDELLESFVSSRSGDDCTQTEGTPQSTAFNNVLNPS